MRSSFVWIIPVMRLQLAWQGELPELAYHENYECYFESEISSIDKIVKAVYSSLTHILKFYFCRANNKKDILCPQ